MIVYKSTKKDFVLNARNEVIADAVTEEYEKRIGRANPAEINAWKHSLAAMASVVSAPEIPDDASVCVEYRLPGRSSRIDFLIAGRDGNGNDNVVIVELKQWDRAKPVPEKDLVETFVGHRDREMLHPSYQAWSYAMTLRDYNETVQKENILLFPCAYLHNYLLFSPDPILEEESFPEVKDAPVFTHDDGHKLTAFIADHIASPDTSEIISRIDSGRIKPSKSLQDALGSLLAGNREFILIDEQKLTYEHIMHQAYRLDSGNKSKHVFIVQGGPGTGKSVIAVNLLAALTAEGKTAAYVTKNSAPRNVYKEKLRAEKMRKGRIDQLFLGSGVFYGLEENSYDVLIVDEAHRLNAKSGLFSNKGENQIKEIIKASRISVFFIDESQQVTSKDIGTVKEIKKHAKEANAKVHMETLLSQFRCNGSDGYLNFLDDALEIEKGVPYTFDESDYDIRIMDDPKEMMASIRHLNEKDNRARMLSGYCWSWDSKKDRSRNDIVIPEYDFAAQWNFSTTSTWAIDENSVEQIGCIHTSQGLEFSYVGVIIGDDLRYENGHVITDWSKRAKSDQSLKGLRTPCRKKDPAALEKADTIIRDTYKTLLSRAMKGCFVYCTDKALAAHLREKLNENRRLYEDFMSIDFTAERP